MSIPEALWKVGKEAWKLKDHGPPGPGAIPGLGLALATVKLWDAYATHEHEEARDRARAILGCNHIEVCPLPVGATATTAMVVYATRKRGMGFLHDGFPLCHHQADLDVKPLSTRVYRWSGSDVVQGNRGMHVQPCTICRKKPEGS